MSCCSDPKPETDAGGSCACGQRPFPWLSAICDPAIGRMFLLRYRRDLLLGAGCGCLTGGAVLAFGDALGGLGPLLGGPWLHFQAAATLPAAILAGLSVSLSLAWNGARGWRAGTGWALAWSALGGLGNGLLSGDGAGVPALALALLLAPATWMVRGALAGLFRQPR